MFFIRTCTPIWVEFYITVEVVIACRYCQKSPSRDFGYAPEGCAHDQCLSIYYLTPPPPPLPQTQSIVLQALIHVIRSAVRHLVASAAAAIQATLLTGMAARVMVSSGVQQPSHAHQFTYSICVQISTSVALLVATTANSFVSIMLVPIAANADLGIG